MGKRKLAFKIVGSILILLLMILGGFLIWAQDYYHAQPTALALLNDESIHHQSNVYSLASTEDTTIGLIFYPGAKVEAIAYLPLLKQISELGIEVYLVEMPLNMAIFDINAATKIIEEHDNITKWYMAGHSMGGAMASKYASDHEDQIEGLILLGAYVYGDYPVDKSLTIYGSFNQSVEDHLDYTENIVEIVGGNHAQFGNYGKQKGDKDATISPKRQQAITVEAIKAFIFKQ